jgi:F0F1-type ATP synthase, delta subunit (mitochondrial oligomycin sensitivity protein)
MTIANRYAKALFELVVEQDQLDSTFEELKQLRDVFQTNDNLAYLLTSVELSLQEKQSILKILTDGATPVVKNLIMMVFDYGRMDDMVAIIDEFERRYDSKKNEFMPTLSQRLSLMRHKKINCHKHWLKN